MAQLTELILTLVNGKEIIAMVTDNISADKCFEVNNTEKNEKSNINADLETASTQHSRARLVLILIHDCYFIVTIIICKY